jgi:superfamily II DNA/RNA helicase
MSAALEPQPEVTPGQEQQQELLQESGPATQVTDPIADLVHEAAASQAGGSDASQPSVESGPAHVVTEPEADLVEQSSQEPAEPAPELEPETSFADLGLSPEILEALTEKGYRIPTPIQAQAIPSVLMGRDVLGCAQTGTGKTASFVLPLLDILTGKRARARMPRCLILEPTRELALQVAENFVQYGSRLKLTHALLIGGESLHDQKDALMKGVDVLIATPGRLMDLFERGGLLLTYCSVLVIDEADRMLDMGFIPDVEKIVGFLPPTRQTLFFSATMAPEIRRLADAFLQNPRQITVSRPASVATTIVAGLTIVDDLDKREALRRMLAVENVANALIFCNRKRDVDILFKSLKRHSFNVGQLHGDMSQPERFATLQKFKANELKLLVCSDVAARGIDIGGLSHVFNFDVPIHAEDYVHRIGRTGRGGMTGHAYTLATPDDRGFVEAIEKLVGAETPRFQIDGMDPLAFAEGDLKRGRGRGRAKSTEKPIRAKVVEHAPDEPVEAPLRKPRRSRSRKPDVVVEAADPAVAPQPEVMPAAVEDVPAPRARRRDEERRPRGDDSRRARPDEFRRSGSDDTRRANADDTRRGSADDSRAPRRDEEPRRYREDEPRRYRRDDDLGPAVLGFGDDVPAFMLLRSRGKPDAAETEQA